MSVRSEPYVIAGYLLDKTRYKEFFNDKEDEEEKLQFPWCGKGAKGKMGILYDGMSGEYIIAGYCIACGGEYDGLSLTEIEDVDEYKSDVLNWMHAHNLLELANGRFKILALTHWH